MASITLALFVTLLTTQVLSWEALPSIPTGRRSQFLVLREDGAYKYGYDTGSGHAGKQEADPANEVQGHYFYKNAAGQDFDLKYKSGVGGFVPENLEKINDFLRASAPSGSYTPSHSYVPAAQPYSSPGDDDSGDYKPDNSGDYTPDNGGEYQPNADDEYQPDDTGEYKPDTSGDSQGDDNSGAYNPNETNTGDASYNFDIDTPTYKRNEAADHSGNIKGSYSYNNKDGTHDLQYVAGSGTGFVAKSGSLSVPNGLRGAGAGAPSGHGGYTHPSASHDAAAALPKSAINPDGSYDFGFSTNDQSRHESGDVNGNVKGSYSFRNKAGQHDLSYKAGSDTGFLVTGGSLAQPNGLPNGAGAGPQSYSAPGAGAPQAYSGPNAPNANFKSSPDGSYSFGFATADQDRQEDGDSNGNVRGKFSYRNSAGNHDLSFVAGSATGFLPTGGSLANPNGLGGAPSLAGLPQVHSKSGDYSGEGSPDSLANTGDSTYNFSFDTPEYTRHEASDPHGNVKGSFSYKNKAGTNDLSFVAGSATGFLPTGGSLSVPNGLGDKGPSALPHSGHPHSDGVEIAAARLGAYFPSSGGPGSGDSSYNFAFDTDEYKRHETADASGNVKGSYSYRNSVGNHDLSFVAGSATGFKPTGGSLSVPPGTGEAQLRSGFKGSSGISDFVGGRSSYDVPAVPHVPGVAPESKSSYSLGNLRVHTYLPPSNEKHKFGYIFDSQ